MMKWKNSLTLLAATIFTLPIGSHGASLTVEPASPTENLILERGDGAALGTAPIQQAFGFRNADTAGTEGTRGRGQSFVINNTPGANYPVSSLAVAMGTSGDDAGYRPDGELTLTIFEWNGTDADDFSLWGFGDNDPVATGAQSGTEVFREIFPIPTGTALTNADFLTITFDDGELNLKDGVAYGFFFRYTLDELVDALGDPLNEDVTVAFDSDNMAPDNAPGALLSTFPSDDFATANNGNSTSRDLNYFITGSAAVPDFEITGFDYDPETTDLTLTWTKTTPGETYRVLVTTDLSDWGRDLNDSFEAAAEGDETTGVFNLTGLAGDLVGAPELFFRVDSSVE